MNSDEANPRLKILILYAEVMSYTISTIRELVRDGCEVHVVFWDTKNLTPYEPPPVTGAIFYPRSKFTWKSLRKLVLEINPDITFVSGWQDKAYLPSVALLRKKGSIVVSGFDSQWQRTLKYSFAKYIGFFGLFRFFFSHAWIPGARQYEFARNLGFRDSEIIFDLYSADTALFANSRTEQNDVHDGGYPHVFLFVGRFEPVKGLEELVSAWRSIYEHRRDWELWLVGNGSLRAWLDNQKDLKVFDFMQPADLVKLTSKVGCFVLPSRSEPWGVVVQEFAAAGLPLILSDAVGAASTFLIHGHNGYVFSRKNPQSLEDTMKSVIQMSDAQLRKFGLASEELSVRITSRTSAANLMSVVQPERGSL